GTREFFASNGVTLGVASTIEMKSNARSLFGLSAPTHSSQPPAAEAGSQPSQIGGSAAPIFALYVAASSLESTQPSPTLASIIAYWPESIAWYTASASCPRIALLVT